MAGLIYATLTMDVGIGVRQLGRRKGRASLGAGLALDTLIGPVSAQIAFDKDGGSRFLFLMGRRVPPGEDFAVPTSADTPAEVDDVRPTSNLLD